LPFDWDSRNFIARFVQVVQQDSYFTIPLLHQDLQALDLLFHVLHFQCVLSQGLNIVIITRAWSPFSFHHVFVDVFKVIEALVDHQSICHHEGLAWVIRFNELIHQFVASVNVFTSEVFFLLSSLEQTDLCLQVGYLFLQPLYDQARVHLLIPRDLVGNLGHPPSELAGS